jgi:hypothetical protein
MFGQVLDDPELVTGGVLDEDHRAAALPGYTTVGELAAGEPVSGHVTRSLIAVPPHHLTVVRAGHRDSVRSSPNSGDPLAVRAGLRWPRARRIWANRA